MQKGMLSVQEYEALMELFEGAKPASGEVQASEHKKRSGESAEALRHRYEALASEWMKAFFTVTGVKAHVRLRTIARKSRVETAEDEVIYRCGEQEYMVCPAPLVNFINEQRLGAGDLIPELMHPLTQIDMQLFEQTAASLFHTESMTLTDRLPEGKPWIEAGFNLEIAPYLRTTFRWLNDESL